MDRAISDYELQMKNSEAHFAVIDAIKEGIYLHCPSGNTLQLH
jgi:hypothetical protein